ncbi:hypothetical protein HBB16_05295 [Pseudonocardia sp. MCCB 268]|nr:hypothetical protein [Pseudonocardia cytotoxica]
MFRRRRASLTLFVVVVALMVATGCGTGQLAQTANQVTATNGAEGRVGAMLVRYAKLHGRAPGRRRHHARASGADAAAGHDHQRCAVLLGPRGRRDRLVSVTSPPFAGGRILGTPRIDVGQAMAAGYDEPVSSVTTTGTTWPGSPCFAAGSAAGGDDLPGHAFTEWAGALTLQLPVANPDFVVPRADGDPDDGDDRWATVRAPGDGPPRGARPRRRRPRPGTAFAPGRTRTGARRSRRSRWSPS